MLLITDWKNPCAGANWDAATNTFTASVNGIYFFAYSVQYLQSRTGIYLDVDSVSHHWIGANVELNDRNTVRGSVMLSLTIGNRVNFRFDNSIYAASFTNYAQGFFYAPIAGPGEAWSVTCAGGTYSGPLDDFSFPFVKVNTGNV